MESNKSNTSSSTDSSTSGSYVVHNSDWKKTVVFHLTRLPLWRLRNAKISKKEQDKMLTTDPQNTNHLMQKFMGWRNSLFLVSLPFMFLTAFFGFLGVADIDLQPFNALGKLAVLSPILSPTVFFLMLCYSAYVWDDFKKSSDICAYGWLFSLVAPIWPALLPIQSLLSTETKDAVSPEDLVVVSLTLGIGYTLQVMPLILTVPVGAIRGSLRILGLLPESMLAGWFIVMIAPIVPLVIFASSVLLTQLLGNGVLITGVVLLICAPLLYVLRRKLYTNALNEAEDKQIETNQRIMTTMSLIGILLIATWAFANDVFPGPASALQFLFECGGRSLTSTIVFADSVFRITVHQLQTDQKRRDDSHYQEVDAFLARLPGGVRSMTDDNDKNVDGQESKV